MYEKYCADYGHVISLITWCYLIELNKIVVKPVIANLNGVQNIHDKTNKPGILSLALQVTSCNVPQSE